MANSNKLIDEQEAWLCDLCEAEFFVLGEDSPVCPHCGNSDPVTLRIKEIEEEERDPQAI